MGAINSLLSANDSKAIIAIGPNFLVWVLPPFRQNLLECDCFKKYLRTTLNKADVKLYVKISVFLRGIELSLSLCAVTNVNGCLVSATYQPEKVGAVGK